MGCSVRYKNAGAKKFERRASEAYRLSILLNDLYRQKQEKIELQQPIHSGWIATFEFRDGTELRKDYETLLEILPIINIHKLVNYSDDNVINNSSFLRIKQIKPEEYERLSELHKSYFLKTLDYFSWINNGAVVYRFALVYLLVPVLKKRYIRKIVPLRPKVMSQIRLVRDKLWVSKFFYKYSKKRVTSFFDSLEKKTNKKALRLAGYQEIKEGLNQYYAESNDDS